MARKISHSRIPDDLIQPQQHLWDCPRQNYDNLLICSCCCQTMYIVSSGNVVYVYVNSFVQVCRCLQSYLEIIQWLKFTMKIKIVKIVKFTQFSMFLKRCNKVQNKCSTPFVLLLPLAVFFFERRCSPTKMQLKVFRDKINQGITASFPPFFSF